MRQRSDIAACDNERAAGLAGLADLADLADLDDAASGHDDIGAARQSDRPERVDGEFASGRDLNSVAGLDLGALLAGVIGGVWPGGALDGFDDGAPRRYDRRAGLRRDLRPRARLDAGGRNRGGFCPGGPRG